MIHLSRPLLLWDHMWGVTKSKVLSCELRGAHVQYHDSLTLSEIVFHFSCKSSNISFSHSWMEFKARFLPRQRAIITSCRRREERKIVGKKEWEVASNTTWTYVRFHWDLLGSRAGRGFNNPLLLLSRAAADSKKKTPTTISTSWFVRSFVSQHKFRWNGRKKFRNYSKVSLRADDPSDKELLLDSVSFSKPMKLVWSTWTVK